VTTDSSPVPDEEPSIPDDVWERFVQDSERAIRATAPKEPSARARMVTRRLREEDERAAAEPPRRRGPRLRRGGGGPSSSATAWRAGTSADAERRLRRRSQLRGLLGVLLVVVLLLIALSPSRAWSWVTGKGGHHSGAAQPAPTSQAPETAAPTAAPPSVDPDVPTLKRPFAGSPAESWGNGADAIVLPAAARYGVSSKTAVATALRQAKDFLVDANLDPAVLAGGRPDKALALIDPAGSGLADIRGSLARPSSKHDPADLFSRFAPAEARLVGNVVKVRGRMTLSKGNMGGVRIDADYTFVYPLREARDQDPSPEIARSIVRRTLSFQLPDPNRWQHTPGRLSLTSWGSYLGNNACGIYDGLLHPGFADTPEPTPTGTASGTPQPTPKGLAIDPYDRSRPLGWGQADCGRLSRT
jgi:hypothetical protein